MPWYYAYDFNAYFVEKIHRIIYKIHKNINQVIVVFLYLKE